MKKLFILIFILQSYARFSKCSNSWRLKNIVTLNWQIATPLSTDYLKETTLAGGNFEYRNLLNQT